MLLSTVDGSPRSYISAARELDRADPRELGLRPLRVSLVSTFTIEVILPYLVVEGARRGLGIRCSVAPFGQLEQQVLAADSSLYRADPECVILATRLEDAAPALVHDFVRLSPDEIERATAELAARVETLVRAIRERTRAHILVWNQILPVRLSAGLADVNLAPSQTEAVVEVNRRIARICRATPSVHVFDVCRVAAEVGLARWHDPKLLHLARIPLSPAGQLAAATGLARCLRALTTSACKCLVLDLDGTLWGGVLGERGSGGIDLGEDYPGSVYKAFQRQLRSYRDRGVLLAIASKNNESDVVDLFATHPDLVLRWEDFAARQIHWNDKASSLAAIAAELNISTDALAFFDDSPVEREWVRTRMPEVHVIDVPPDALRYAAALEDSGAFDHLVLTEEDRARAELYRSDAQRHQLAESATSVDEFLRSLRMRVTIGPIDSATLPRVAQLLAKTNQFNTTTRRHAQSDVERMLAGGAVGLWMRVEDRFGDNGLVGIALAVDHAPRTVALDSFLLSCRVLGRKAELALLDAIARRAAARGATQLLGEFIPTKKNAPAARLFADGGFSELPNRPGWWQRELDPTAPSPSLPFEVVELP